MEATNSELDPGDFLIKVDEMKINIRDKTLASTQIILTEDVRKLKMIEKNAAVTCIS